MEYVKVGNTTFNVESLKGMSLTEAYSNFEHIRKDIVKTAHQQVNGSKTKKRKK